MTTVDEKAPTAMLQNRRLIQPTTSKGVKPAGYWFKQRGYTDPLLDRRTATTTGQMLYQIYDPRPPPVVLQENLPPTPPSSSIQAANRRRETYSNRYSEHDNRNIIQSYGEYFGRGFGKRLMPQSALPRSNWVLTHQPIPAPTECSITQRDYRGWPPLESQQQMQQSMIGGSRRKSSAGHWMTTCYDDWGTNVERVPTELIYRDDYKRLPIHPWHY